MSEAGAKSSGPGPAGNDVRPGGARGDRPATRGIVVGHAQMAHGLVEAVRKIAGDAAAGLTPVSNDGMGPEQLKAALEQAAGAGPTLVFVDLESGSCGIAAAYACRASAERAVVCGVNLPMLLDFVFHRGLPLDELVTRVVERGRSAIRSTRVGR